MSNPSTKTTKEMPTLEPPQETQSKELITPKTSKRKTTTVLDRKIKKQRNTPQEQIT
jgi:hypothetical protein